MKRIRQRQIFLFFADDERFIGCDVSSNRFSENDKATANGYIAALEKAADGLPGKPVLLLGYGRVGHEMLPVLIKRGAKPKVYDNDPAVLEGLDDQYILKSDKEIKEFSLILDATNRGGWMRTDMIHKDAWIATPGIPLSLDNDAYQKHGGRLIHDCLQLGTAVMMGELCK